MAITRMGKISAVLVAAMLISACGANIHGQQEKIAVVNWDKAQAEIEAEMSVAAGVVQEHSRAVSVQREEAAGRGEEDAIF